MSTQSKKSKTGRAPRKLKVLKDNIQGITKPAIKRVARRAGVKRVDKDCYEEVRGIIMDKLEEIIKVAATLMENAKRKTLMSKDVRAAAEVLGVSLIGFSGVTTENLTSVVVAPKKISKSTKTHKFKPGTVALKEIRHYQKSKGCILFRRLPFARLVKEILQNNTTLEVRISKEASDLIQQWVEQYLVKLLEVANYNAIHAGRTTVEPKDIQLALRAREERD